MAKRRSSRGLYLAGAIVGVVASALAAMTSLHGDRPTLAVETVEASLTPQPVSGALATDTENPRSARPPTPAVVDSSISTPPTSSAGANPAATVTTDGIVAYAGHEYAIGDPGDEIAVGEFACSGTTTAALLRPGSGEVFIFDGWADEKSDRVATALTVVPIDSHWLIVDRDAQGCVALAAQLADGTTAPIAWPIASIPPSPTTSTQLASTAPGTQP